MPASTTDLTHLCIYWSTVTLPQTSRVQYRSVISDIFPHW